MTGRFAEWLVVLVSISTTIQFPLAQLVLEKTAGNPFFVIQFLHALADEKLLTFDHQQKHWCWSPDRIHAMGYTDNIVDLMVGKLTRLPAQTQHALQQLACLGNVAGTAALSTVLGMSKAQVRAVFWDAIRQELVHRLEGAYGFAHDRIHEAAYSLIPKDARAEAHLRIVIDAPGVSVEELRPVREVALSVVNQVIRRATRAWLDAIVQPCLTATEPDRAAHVADLPDRHP